MDRVTSKEKRKTINILLVDDHIVTRQGVRLLLEKTNHLHVVAEAQNGEEAVQFNHQYHPDVIIMDINMPELDGIEATKRILKDDPDRMIIALSSHHNRKYIKKMIQAGAAAYVDKNCTFDELKTAIELALKGQHFMSKRIADIVMKEFKEQLSTTEIEIAPPALTNREREVLKLIAEGLTTKEIAAHLKISTKTVEAHRRQTMEKLNVSNVADLTKYAIREGLTSLDT